MTVIMCFANMFITPLFFGCAEEGCNGNDTASYNAIQSLEGWNKWPFDYAYL